MPPDMDMGGMNTDSRGSESSLGESQFSNPESSHVMTRMEMVADGVEQGAEIKSDIRNSSNRLSSCAHEACSQMATSTPSLNTNHFQPNFILWIATNVSPPMKPPSNFYATGLGTPPKGFAADRLTLALRI